MKRYKIGYTQGVFDMFHIGHLNLINNAKKFCDYLIVAVNSDELVKEYKHKIPVINQEERRYIVENLKAVDEAVIAETLDKAIQLKKYCFNAIFIGDDWKGNARWEATKEEFAQMGIDVIFLPHTEGVSSTNLRRIEKNKITDNL